MSIFDSLPKSDCEIVSATGQVSQTKAAILPENIVVTDTKIPIAVGDEIRRRIPSGQDEVYEVLDPAYFESWKNIPAHYKIKYRRKGTFKHGEGGNYTIQLSGNNARVNIRSHDQSTNVAVEGDVFGDLTAALKGGVSNGDQLANLLSAVDQMRKSQKQPGFPAAFQKFMSLCADCLQLVTPFLPALTELLPKSG
ncbi:hypothetical protein [Bradyrhizobium sp. MOS002]|uniref:hypothetical protein n=1 Tax=Bradyrhizobium sp. MOS002 TaxID=2133947 RepID=UPI000D126590|nr:hypothetical protein [Bradyrhizobium sp. MOS002]PSO29817.1 hypothetical protein C7G41_24035 [Bradyrhizobium sp. MOS002]